jgi:hypothetical protein
MRKKMSSKDRFPAILVTKLSFVTRIARTEGGLDHFVLFRIANQLYPAA